MREITTCGIVQPDALQTSTAANNQAFAAQAVRQLSVVRLPFTSACKCCIGQCSGIAYLGFIVVHLQKVVMPVISGGLARWVRLYYRFRNINMELTPRQGPKFMANQTGRTVQLWTFVTRTRAHISQLKGSERWSSSTMSL